jgi:Tfp pilus assembly protein PilV
MTRRPSGPPVALRIRMRRWRDEGCSLLEVMVATSILCIALLAVARILASTTRLAEATRNVTAATLLAMDRVERIRAGEFSAIPVEGEDEPAGGRFIRRWTSEPLASAPGDAAVFRVVVTDRNGAPLARVVTVRASR